MSTELDELRTFRAQDAAPDERARQEARLTLMTRIENGSAVGRRRTPPPSPRRRRARRPLGILVPALAAGIAVAVAAVAILALGRRTSPRPARTPATTSAATSAPPVSGPVLVYMRRLQPSNELFEAVTVDTDGATTVGFFMGEIAGVLHHDFRLAPGQLAQVRRLAAAVGRSGNRPAAQHSLESTVYTIRANGRTVQVVAGHVPHGLLPLVDRLNALIDRYY